MHAYRDVRLQDILSINEGQEKSWMDLFRAYLILLYFGLTQPEDEQAREDSTDA